MCSLFIRISGFNVGFCQILRVHFYFLPSTVCSHFVHFSIMCSLFAKNSLFKTDMHPISSKNQHFLTIFGAPRPRLGVFLSWGGVGGGNMILTSSIPKPNLCPETPLGHPTGWPRSARNNSGADGACAGCDGITTAQKLSKGTQNFDIPTRPVPSHPVDKSYPPQPWTGRS